MSQVHYSSNSDAPGVQDPLPRFSSTRYPATASYIDVASDKLRRAGESLHFPAEDQERMVALVRELWAPWGHTPIGQPRYKSFAAIDGAPIELSFAWDGKGPEIRMGFETLGEPPSRKTNLGACQAVTRYLAERLEVPIDRLLHVEDLFVAPDPVFLYPMGHVIAWRAGQAPLFKVYLNTQIHGPEQASPRTDEAMRRLGVEEAWNAIRQHCAAVGAPAPVTVNISLDLGDPKASRIKVYVLHLDVDGASIDRQAEIAATHVPGKFEQALRRITGHSTAGWKKPPVTHFTLVEGQRVPSSATLFIPLIPEIDTDASARDRVRDFMVEEGVDPSQYVSSLEAVSDRPLSESATQNFVSYRPDKQPRFAVYIAPGLYTDA